MKEARARDWGEVLLAGVLYAVIGVAFGALANRGTFPSTRAWRLAAWLVSLILFFAQIARERSLRGRSAVGAASRAALGAALGGFGLALAATLHPHPHARWFPLMLVVWPIVIGIPAFVAAWIVGLVIRPRGL